MKGNIYAGLLGDLHEIPPHGFYVGRGATDRELDTGPGGKIQSILQGNSAGEAGDVVNVEIIVGNDSGDPGDLEGCDLFPSRVITRRSLPWAWTQRSYSSISTDFISTARFFYVLRRAYL